MPKRKLPSDSIILRLYRNGRSTGEIAEQYNVAATTVVGFLRRIGEPRRNPKEAAKIRTTSGRHQPARYWEGKKQPADMVEKRVSKIRGKNHYLWKGGKSRRDYRKVKTKINCEKCNATTNLGIHHKDYDHYNNNPKNLQTLCVSCHMSLHKSQYWAAIKSGKEPKRSNGIVGWKKKD